MYLHLANESFNKNKKPIKESMSVNEIDKKLIECKNTMVKCKSRAIELKEQWNSLAEDYACMSFAKAINTNIRESYQKAIDTLKIEYDEAKATYNHYKELKNKTLLEAEITIPQDKLNDPTSPVNLLDIAKERDEYEKEMSSRAKYQELANTVLTRVHEMYEQESSTEEILQYMFDELVPDHGKCETVAGEMVRAMMMVLVSDTWYDEDYEDAASSVEYLVDYIESLRDEFESTATRGMTGTDYNDAIVNITNKLVDYLMDNEHYFTEANEEDSRNYTKEWVKEFIPTFDIEIPVSEKLREFVEAGKVDSWRLKSYVEDALSYDSAYEGAETSTPWSHYDTTVTVEKLNRDGYAQLKNTVNNESDLEYFWLDLYNDVVDEYPRHECHQCENEFFEEDMIDDEDGNWYCERCYDDRQEDDLDPEFEEDRE